MFLLTYCNKFNQTPDVAHFLFKRVTINRPPRIHLDIVHRFIQIQCRPKLTQITIKMENYQNKINFITTYNELHYDIFCK